MASSGKGSQGGVVSFGDGSHAAYKQQIMSGVAAMAVAEKGSTGDDLLDLMDNA